MPACSVCGRAADFRCSGCKRLAYCNKACQTAGWRDHRYDCLHAIGSNTRREKTPAPKPRRHTKPRPGGKTDTVVVVNARKVNARADAKRLAFLARLVKERYPVQIQKVLDSDGTVDTAKLREEARRASIIRVDTHDIALYVAFSRLITMWSANNAPLAEIKWLDSGGLPPNLQLIKVLGSGAYGEVWLAKEIASGQRFAAKILIDESSLDDEGVILQWINPVTAGVAANPNVLSYIGAWTNWVPPGSTDGVPKPLLVAEFVDGVTFEEIQTANNSMHWAPWFDISWITEQVFSGLAFLHGRGVAHRDIKYDNIMIQNPHIGSDGEYRFGRVVIIDLGLSCIVDNISQETRLIEKACMQDDTQGGAWVYLSPEVAAFYERNQILAVSQPTNSPDMSVQYANDVWAAALTLLGLMLGRFAIEYIVPEIGTGNTPAHYLHILRGLSGPGGVAALQAGKSAIDARIRARMRSHMRRMREATVDETVRWRGAQDICEDISGLLLSPTARVSAEKVRAHFHDLISDATGRVWRDGDAREVSRVDPYDYVF